jgi:predicted dehydrogenase
MYVGPGHGAYAAFQPGSALAMGFDDLKVIEAHNFLRSIAEGTPHGTTLRDAVRSAATLDAMAASAESGTWVKVPTP